MIASYKKITGEAPCLVTRADVEKVEQMLCVKQLVSDSMHSDYMIIHEVCISNFRSSRTLAEPLSLAFFPP